MSRRKPNYKMKFYLLEIASDYTIKELLDIVNNKFNEHYEENELRKYLWRNKIPYKYECENKSHNNAGKNVAIGTTRIKDGDRIQIKINNRDWIYKQRYIYEQHYNEKLSDNDFIIFLDGNKNNFDIDNLMKITRYEGAHLGNIYPHSTNKELRQLSVVLAKMIIKTKNKEKEYEQTRI